METHVIYVQLTSVKKGIRWPVLHDCIAGSSVQLIELMSCFEVIRWPVIGFDWSQAQVHNEKAIH